MQVAFYLAGEITQVKESIPGVRCASGNVFDTRLYFKNWHSIPGKMTKPKSSHLDEMDKQRDSRFRTWTNWPSIWSQAAYSNEDQNSAFRRLWLHVLLSIIDVRSEDFDCTFDSKSCVENSSTAKKDASGRRRSSRSGVQVLVQSLVSVVKNT